MALSLRHRRAARRPEAGRPRDAVVLSGGGSLGAAQVGALRALYEAGIRPDLFIGCSVGALNAAFMAVDPTMERLNELETVWRKLERGHVFGRVNKLTATQAFLHAVRRDDHLYEPDALRQLVRTWVPLKDLGETAVPCHVVTTDLHTGTPCWWSDGDPLTILTASACLPALFPPRGTGGSLHVDGAVRVWVLDVSGGSLGRRDDRMSALDVLLQSFAISRMHLDRPVTGMRPDQQVIRLRRPDLGRLEMRDFTQTPRVMAAGYAVGREALTLAEIPVQRIG
jgi:NTE family protein